MLWMLPAAGGAVLGAIVAYGGVSTWHAIVIHPVIVAEAFSNGQLDVKAEIDDALDDARRAAALRELAAVEEEQVRTAEAERKLGVAWRAHARLETALTVASASLDACLISSPTISAINEPLIPEGGS